MLCASAICFNTFDVVAQKSGTFPGPAYVPSRALSAQQKVQYDQAVKSNYKAAKVARITGGSCNLVINGNFETQKTATISGYYSNVLSLIGNADELANWQATNSSTPDYFTFNASPGQPVYPSTAHAGGFTPYNQSRASAGIFTWTNNSFPYSEYITGVLTTALDGTRSYYASMQVMGASAQQYVTSIGLDVTVGDPMAYANNPYYHASSVGPGTYSHSGCGIQSAGFIQNNGNTWTRVAKIFPGKTGAKYINIGNFNYDDHTLANKNAQFASAYQYIDEVEIYEIPIAGPNKSCTDTSKTIGLGCAIPNAQYAWSPTTGLNSPGSITTSANPPTTTTYTLTVTLPNGSTFATQTTVEVCSCNQAPGYIDGVMDFDAGRLTATIDPVPGATSYRWYKDGVLKSNVTGTGCSWIISRGSCGNAEVSVEAYIPSCGYTSKRTQLFVGQFGSCRTASTTLVYPNPTADVLIVDSGGVDGQLYLYDGKGVLRRKVTLRSDAAQTHINVRDLPAGNYHLHIVRTGQSNIDQQITVQH